MCGAAEAAKQQAETAEVQQQLHGLQAEVQAASTEQEAAQQVLRKWQTQSSQYARYEAQGPPWPLRLPCNSILPCS